MGDPAAVIALVYVVLFAALICSAMAQKRTVWSLLAESFRDIAKAMERGLAALALLPQPRTHRHGGAVPTRRDRRIEAARAAYMRGTIEADEMERQIDAALRA